ncbi:hypothetical protein EMCRGX_G017994 [Ephydatia muelleri]
MNDTLEKIRNVTCKFSQPIQNVQEPYADSCNKVIDVLCVLADINAAIISTQHSILDTNYGRDAHYMKRKKSNVRHFDILGAPIGEFWFCAKYVAQKLTDTSKLLQQLAHVGSSDPHVAMLLLRQCWGFCMVTLLARTIPSSLAGDALSLFDDEVWQCFSECTTVDTPDPEQQAQISLSRGGVGLRLVSYH